MKPRRRPDQAPTDPHLPAGGKSPVASGSRLDLVTAESEEELEGWSRRDRQLFAELLEDAPSELQRELLRRALAAGHRPAELHAFADAIRPLSDGQVFAACTLASDAAARHPVVERLRAEADPLHAYELNGGELTPQERSAPAIRLPPGMMVEVPTSPALPRRELGVSEDEATTGRHDVRGADGRPAQQVEGRFAEDLFNEAVRPLGLSFVEQAVDGVGLPLDDALGRAAEALRAGIPVPVLLGATAGDYRRYALLLQVQQSGNRRVFELHDPFAHETVWVHEGDFHARKELPLADKALRRITAIALPPRRR